MLTVIIAVNGLLAASEIALLSVNPNKIKQLADEGNKTAKLLKKTLDNPNRFLSAVQIGISLAGLFSGAFAASNFSEPVAEFLVNAGVPFSADTLGTAATIGITLTLSYFSLVFGELVPKRIAMKKANTVAKIAVKPLNILATITSPFVAVLNLSTNLALRIVGLDPKSQDDEVTEAEIRLLVDVGEESGAIDEEEKEMINNIFEFDNKTADEIAIHRKDIVALSANATIEEMVQIVLNGKYSRIPVYDETIDNIIGILYAKDFFRAYMKKDSEIDIRKLARKPYVVPTSKKTNELFAEMQKTKMHLAVVIDEYGGTAGIVSLEDLIEEIMGNILDEYDDEEKPEIQTIDQNTFLVDGQTLLEDASEFFSIELPTDEYETIGGFILGLLGRIPENDEKPEVEYSGLIFKIEDVSDRRVHSITVIKPLALGDVSE
jgi:putative hemolysin